MAMLGVHCLNSSPWNCAKNRVSIAAYTLISCEAPSGC